MKVATALILVWGLLVNESAHAEKPKIPRPRWVTVATVIDMITGERLGELELAGSAEREFDDPIQCGSAARKVGPLFANNHTAVVLTCRKVGPPEVNL
jgi:hypothetical protein